MKKIYLIIFGIVMFQSLSAQAPYIGTAVGDGLGQYGYLEKDAVTFSRLFRNTYNNIAYLSARWWITDNSNINGNGKEYIYHVYGGPDWNPLVGWQCGGDNDGSKRTTDFIASDFSPEWGAGSDCYVSVCAKYCDDSYYPASYNGATTFGATGFNERHFQVLDVDTSLHPSTSSLIPDGNGLCVTNNTFHVAGSFSIAPGGLTGLTMTRLYVLNRGTAAEGVEFQNAAFQVYYEPANGSEVFGDGNETFAGTLYGDWGGGSTNDNVYGNEALNISLNGPQRVYLLLCDFNNATGIGKTVDLAIINDGISLSPALDSYTKMRIDERGISRKLITLPVRIQQFMGSRNQQQVELQWQLSGAAANDRFIIQASSDGRQFSNLINQPATAFVRSRDLWQYRFNTTSTYFRLQVQSANGQVQTSSVIHLPWTYDRADFSIVNPVGNTLTIINQQSIAKNYSIRLMTSSGQTILQKNQLLVPGNNAIALPERISSQMLVVQLTDRAGQVQSFKCWKSKP